MGQSTARYVRRRGGHRQGAKEKGSAHRLAQLRASPRRDPFRVNLASHRRFRVDFVDVLESTKGQRMGYYRVSGGHTHLAAGSRTSSETQVHQVSGDGRVPELMQPLTRTSRVRLGFQAGQGRGDRERQARGGRMKYAKTRSDQHT
jgi:hypothetical protein